jgi:hypothetical protein
LRAASAAASPCSREKRVKGNSDEACARECLASDFYAFGGEFNLAYEDAGYVAAGM